jgi:hypothetical protein
MLFMHVASTRAAVSHVSHDRRVRELRQDGCFSHEPIRVTRSQPRHHLEGHRFARHEVRAAVDHPHAAGPRKPLDHKAIREHFACLEADRRHGREAARR